MIFKKREGMNLDESDDDEA